MTNKKHKKIIFALIPLALFLYFILWPGDVAYAARIWQSGFETSDLGIDTTEFDNDLFNGAGALTLDTAIVRTGTRSLKAAANNSTTEVGGTSFLGITGTEVYVGFGFYMAANPGPQTAMFYLYDASQLTLLRIQVQATTGKLMLINRTSGTDVTVGTTASALSTGAWHYIEMHLLKSATVGVAQLRVDGTLVIDGQNLNTSGRGTPTLISFANDSSASGTTADFYWDDAVVNDTSGSLNNSWPGNSKIVTLVPGSDTATINWTAQNAGTHFSEVDDLPGAVDITTYIKTTNGVVGLEDRWNMTDTPAGIGSCDTINAIAVGVRGGSTAATLSPAAKIQLRDASGNTADATAQTYNLNGWKTAYPALIKQQTWAATPAAMTKAYLDGMIAAAIVTTQANQEMRITAVWVTVDYATASCPAAAARNRFTFASMRKYKIMKGLVRIRLQ